MTVFRKRSPLEGKATALLLLLLTAACESREASQAWSGSVDTLPDGRVRIVNSSQGLWTEDDRWRLVPELTVGVVEGAESEVFANLIGLEADAEGRFYVLDRDLNELRVFSSDGSHLATAGRTGEGPGEYQAANGLEWLSPDSLVIVDQRGNRYSVLTKEGAYVRSVPRGLGFYGWAFEGNVVDGRVFELSHIRQGDEYPPAYVSIPLRNVDDQEVPDSPSPGSGVESTSGSLADTIFLPLPDAPQYESFSIRTERGGMTMGVPFAPSAVYHLDRSGTLWHGHGSDFRIFHSSLEGDTIREIVLEAEPVPVPPEAVEAWAAGPGPQRFREMGGDLDLDRIPDVKPFFRGLYLDPDGFLWISVPASGGGSVFALVDPDGRYLGRLVLEGVDRSTFVDPVVKAGRLYVVGRDELGVQRVHVFRIEK